MKMEAPKLPLSPLQKIYTKSRLHKSDRFNIFAYNLLAYNLNVKGYFPLLVDATKMYLGFNRASSSL